jgi:hypothetical protein
MGNARSPRAGRVVVVPSQAGANARADAQPPRLVVVRPSQTGTNARFHPDLRILAHRCLLGRILAVAPLYRHTQIGPRACNGNDEEKAGLAKVPTTAPGPGRDSTVVLPTCALQGVELAGQKEGEAQTPPGRCVKQRRLARTRGIHAMPHVDRESAAGWPRSRRAWREALPRARSLPASPSRNASAAESWHRFTTMIRQRRQP